MTRKPSAPQRLLHRLIMLRRVSDFFAPRVHRIDQAILRLTKGKFTLSQILGWDIVQLTSIGAKSGRPHTMPLVGLIDGDRIALIASSFGRKHNPAWYYNLKAHPECTVRWNGKTGVFVARETMGAEYQRYWQLGVSIYAGYERYKERAAHRHIPVMLLEPKS